MAEQSSSNYMYIPVMKNWKRKLAVCLVKNATLIPESSCALTFYVSLVLQMLEKGQINTTIAGSHYANHRINTLEEMIDMHYL